MRVFSAVGAMVCCASALGMSTAFEEALFKAAGQGDITQVRKLSLEKIVPVAIEKSDSPGCAPFYCFSHFFKNIYITASESEKLPRFSRKHIWYNAARIAALRQHLDILEYLFEKKGLDLCVADKEGKTIWNYASRQGCRTTINWLMGYLKEKKRDGELLECAICLDDITEVCVCDYSCLTIICSSCKDNLKKGDKCPGCRRPMSDVL